MAYSMFSRPKLKNAKETSYYPENEYPVDQNYHHQCHYNYGQNGEGITIEHIPRKYKNKKESSMKTKANSEKKCPIYTHPIEDSMNYNMSPHTYKKVSNYLNDLYSVEQEPNIYEKKYQNYQNSKKLDINRKTVFSHLEESYWANWKPQKEQNSSVARDQISKPIRTKSPTKRKGKSKMQSVMNDHLQTMVGHYSKAEAVKASPSEGSEKTLRSSYCLNENKSNSKLVGSQEIQTEYTLKDAETLSRIDEETHVKNVDEENSENVTQSGENEQNSVNDQKQSDSVGGINEEEETGKEIIELKKAPSSTDKVPVRDSTSDVDQMTEEDYNRLRHTDSFILTKMKQTEDRVHYQQPKCIRLYKKPGPTTTTGYVRGGSYPLKSCLKKESSFGCKRNIRLGRPGSPLIVTSNYYNNFSRSFRK